MELGTTTANCFCLTYTLKGSDCVVSEDSWFNSIKSAPPPPASPTQIRVKLQIANEMPTKILDSQN